MNKKAPKPAKKEAAPKVSKPDSDFSHRTIPVHFERRAGLATYAQELVERLGDLNDDPATQVYYLLPVKLPKKVYKRLLERSLRMAQLSPDWTERDELEALVLFLDAKNLTEKTGKV